MTPSREDDHGALVRDLKEGERITIETQEGALSVQLRAIAHDQERIALSLELPESAAIRFLDVPLPLGGTLSIGTCLGPVHIDLARIRPRGRGRDPRAIVRLHAHRSVRFSRPPGAGAGLMRGG